jgi:hypothetical protein
MKPFCSWQEVVIFGPEGVQVRPIPKKKGPLDKLFDKIPELIEQFEKK